MPYSQLEVRLQRSGKQSGKDPWAPPGGHLGNVTGDSRTAQVIRAETLSFPNGCGPILL